MTTTAQLIDGTRADYLHEHPPLNQLDGPAAAADTQITLLRELGTARDGAHLSVGLEDMRIWQTSGQTVGVLRGADGTTAQDHDDGTLVYVAARFTPAAILRAVNAELRALSGEGLWRAATVDLTTDATQTTYDLDADGYLGLHEVRYDDTAPHNDWPLVPAVVDTDADTDDFPSGLALHLRGYVEPGRPMRVTYRRGFDTLEALDSDVEDTTGLWPEAHDILQIGAAARLMAGTEIARSRPTPQGDIRRAGEVPPGTNLQASRGLLALRERRIAEELRRIRSVRPVPMGTR